MPDIASAVISKQWPTRMVQPEDGNRANTQSGLNKIQDKQPASGTAAAALSRITLLLQGLSEGELRKGVAERGKETKRV